MTGEVDSLNLIGKFLKIVINVGLCPLWSPDLTVCEFYLGGNLQNKGYARNLHNLAKLKEHIRKEINSITEEEQMGMHRAFLSRCRKCVDVGREHFQHLLS